MSIVLSVNLKGGVAKTTTAVAVAECLASENQRTLLIDADHQCMAGELVLGEGRQIRNEQTKRNMYRLLMDMMFDETFAANEFEKRITRKVSNIGGGLDKLAVLSCSMRMDEIYTKIRDRQKEAGLTWKEIVMRLTRWRGQFARWMHQEFDFVIVDCPPSFAFQVKFFLSIADSYIVPCVPERLSVRGSLYLMDRIKVGGFKVKGLGTLWSLYREVSSLHRQRVQASRSGTDPDLQSMPPPFETVIPNATRIAEASEFFDSKPKTFTMKYSTEFARLFASLSHEIVERSASQQDEPMKAEGELVEI